jgi:hypothetical protein
MDFIQGLVNDFHKAVGVNDKSAAQVAFSEIKKIFGFGDDEAKAFVDARKTPEPAPAAPAPAPVQEAPKQ